MIACLKTWIAPPPPKKKRILGILTSTGTTAIPASLARLSHIQDTLTEKSDRVLVRSGLSTWYLCHILGQLCVPSVTYIVDHKVIYFLLSRYTASVPENMAAITQLTIIQPVGLDVESHVFFTLLNNQDLFTVGETSGVLSTTGLEFDREESDNYTVVIKVWLCVNGLLVILGLLNNKAYKQLTHIYWTTWINHVQKN